MKVSSSARRVLVELTLPPSDDDETHFLGSSLSPRRRTLLHAIPALPTTGGFAHVYLATSAVPLPVGSPRATTKHVLKRMAVPDKRGVHEVGKEVEVMVGTHSEACRQSLSIDVSWIVSHSVNSRTTQKSSI